MKREHPSWQQNSPRGSTLLELVVTVAVIAILVSLLLFGVQTARETARRAYCSSNLRQVALGATNYADTHRAFPAGTAVGYGPHVAILPYIEQQPLYDLVDYSLPLEDGTRRIRGKSVSVFLCPADGGSPQQFFGEQLSGTNYAGNAGVWYVLRPFDGAFRYWEQAQGGGPPLRPAEFLDGLSATALFSEVPRADGSTARLRNNWVMPFGFAAASDLRAFQAICRGLPADPAAAGWTGVAIHRGTPWTHGNVAKTLYTHTLTPNLPSCLNGTGLRSAAATAASFHNGGVNVAFADAHVAFVSDSVEQQVWHAYGTRDSRDF